MSIKVCIASLSAQGGGQKILTGDILERASKNLKFLTRHPKTPRQKPFFGTPKKIIFLYAYQKNSLRFG